MSWCTGARAQGKPIGGLQAAMLAATTRSGVAKAEHVTAAMATFSVLGSEGLLQGGGRLLFGFDMLPILRLEIWRDLQEQRSALSNLEAVLALYLHAKGTSALAQFYCF